MICGGAEGEVVAAAAAAATTSGAPPPPLDWKFSQVFGERAAGEDVQEGM
jgi:serine/threonine-protein phosphatase 2A regulatory subunit B